MKIALRKGEFLGGEDSGCEPSKDIGGYTSEMKSAA